jgi:long-chain fatty acid transport protein
MSGAKRADYRQFSAVSAGVNRLLLLCQFDRWQKTWRLPALAVHREHQSISPADAPALATAMANSLADFSGASVGDAKPAKPATRIGIRQLMSRSSRTTKQPKETMKTSLRLKPAKIAVFGLTALAAGRALATDGYFDYGYGIQAKGIGGAGVAFPQDSLAPAANPAGVAFLDNRLDVGLAYFQPDRSASLGPNNYDGNGKEQFYLPEIGFKHSLTTDYDFGLAVYGNGGMNTDYKNIPNFGSTHTGVDLSQLFIAPTLTYKLAENHAIGIAPIIAYQRFKAYGLENFGITYHDYDNSYGGGVRLGYTGRLTDWLTVGVTYQSEIFTTRFKDYDHLFAEQGSFVIPSNFAVGLAVKPVKQVTFALDIEEILYSDINSVGDKLSSPGQLANLGQNNGPGFGWRDVTVIKTGIAYDATEQLTLRLGYNYSTQPIPDDQTTFNILAPGVVQHHVTAGATWRFNQHWEVTAFYAHAFKQEVNGDGSFSGAANLSMSQDTFGLAAGWIL